MLTPQKVVDNFSLEDVLTPPPAKKTADGDDVPTTGDKPARGKKKSQNSGKRAGDRAKAKAGGLTMPDKASSELARDADCGSDSALETGICLSGQTPTRARHARKLEASAPPEVKLQAVYSAVRPADDPIFDELLMSAAPGPVSNEAAPGKLEGSAKRKRSKPALAKHAPVAGYGPHFFWCLYLPHL
jgi:hypothetical protein